MRIGQPEFVLGLLQMAMTPDPADNLARAVRRIEEATRRGARMVCLPELFRSRYFCQREDRGCFDLAEPILGGPTTKRMQTLAKKLDVVIVAPVFERRAAGLYHNSAVVIDADGRVAGVYRKTHIPDDPGYYEKFYFVPGDLGYRTFDTQVGRLGALICWDQWFPEAARLMALQGAGVLLYPTAIGWHPREKARQGAGQLDAWLTVQRGHAISNGVYVAAVNRVGHEKPDAASEGIEFWGSSFASDPFGVVTHRASADREETLYVPVKLGRIEDVRRTWPFLRDRRVDTYGAITTRFLDPEPC
jgi:N-carbamoylputrescine amidase